MAINYKVIVNLSKAFKNVNSWTDRNRNGKWKYLIYEIKVCLKNQLILSEILEISCNSEWRFYCNNFQIKLSEMTKNNSSKISTLTISKNLQLSTWASTIIEFWNCSYKIFEWFQNYTKKAVVTKNEKEAERFKKMGNSYYIKKQLKHALHFYNKSLRHSPHNSIIFSLTLANRSAVHFELSNYDVKR